MPKRAARWRKRVNWSRFDPSVSVMLERLSNTLGVALFAAPLAMAARLPAHTDDLNQAESLQLGPVRDRFLQGRALLRAMVQLCGEAPLQLELERDAAPSVRGTSLWLSHARSHGLWVGAASRTGPVGVDLEQVGVDPLPLNEELGFDVRGRTLDDQFRAWVRIEAAAKAAATGVDRLDRDAVRSILQLSPGEGDICVFGRSFRLTDVDRFAPDYALALCIQT